MAAFLEFNYFSKALKTPTTVNVLLPEIEKKEEGAGAPEGEFSTLYLFHGMSSDHTTWLRRTDVDLYCKHYGIAIVMPEVGNNWYTDTAYGKGFLSFVGEELPDVCARYFRGISTKKEKNLVAGNSMGGYGAVKAALTYPERFGACISLSGSLDVTRKGRSVDLENWRGIFGFDLTSPLDLEGTEHDLFSLAEKQTKSGVTLPDFYLWCGTEDGLIGINRSFDAHLNRLKVPHFYEESEGTHSWKWWDLHLDRALRYYFPKNSTKEGAR